jgi:SAM-dependent methyltransferase
VQRRVRPAIFHRLDLALAEIAAHESPSVLDIGCGPGRVAEHVLAAGAGDYVGVDFSKAMLELAAERLRRFGPTVTLVHGDILDVPLTGPFDVVLALGLFDYVAQPDPIVLRMRELDGPVVIATFPLWDWVKGPIRKLRYEVLADCPISDYTEPEVHRLFQACGFASVETLRRGRSDLVVRASA